MLTLKDLGPAAVSVTAAVTRLAFLSKVPGPRSADPVKDLLADEARLWKAEMAGDIVHAAGGLALEFLELKAKLAEPKTKPVEPFDLDAFQRKWDAAIAAAADKKTAAEQSAAEKTPNVPKRSAAEKTPRRTAAKRGAVKKK